MTDTVNTLADPGSDPAHEWKPPAAAAPDSGPVGDWVHGAMEAGMGTHDWGLVQSQGDVTEAVQEAITAALEHIAPLVRVDGDQA
jgi:hypothetical protein